MSLDQVLLIAIPGVLLVGAVLVLMLRGRGQRAAGWVAAACSALSLGAILALIPTLQLGSSPAVGLDAGPMASFGLSLRLDWLGLPFVITATGVTLVAVVYGWGYHRRGSGTHTFYAWLLVFAAGMAGTVLADGMLLFYTFWELMLVASCGLIAVWGEGKRRGQVALKYFIFTHLGSLMILVGLVVLFGAAGSDSISSLQAGIGLAPQTVTAVTALFLIGFCVKMAVFPLHLWLPDAHAVAPMPVTIMLAAAMLGMGTYGILRFPLSIFSRAQLEPFAAPMMVAGIISAIYGALMALAERDIKRIVAYSSVSQMGYILFGLGTLTHDGIAGAIAHVVFHAIVKALLFMCVGLLMRATGRRTITELGGLGRTMPVVAVCTGVGALAIAGMPPLCMFVSEWLIFSGGFHTGRTWLALAMVLSSILTVGYSLWFFGRIFISSAPDGLGPEEEATRRLPPAMMAPTGILAVLALVAGLVPAPVLGMAENALRQVLGGLR